MLIIWYILGQNRLFREVNNNLSDVPHDKLLIVHKLAFQSEFFLFCLITQVINLRTIRPLDMDTVVRSVKKTHNLITVEGGWPQSSIGTEIITNTLESLYSGIWLG